MDPRRGGQVTRAWNVRRGLLAGLALAMAMVVALGSFGMDTAGAQQRGEARGRGHEKIKAAPPERVAPANRPQRRVEKETRVRPVAPEMQGAHAADPIEMKVLVISGNGDDGQPAELPS